MEYNNNHKIILQTVIHEGALDEDRGTKLVNSLFGMCVYVNLME